MSEIQTIENSDGLKILTREGRLLCSPRDPQSEAIEWIKRQKISKKDKKILLLGFGSGFHYQALKNDFPESKIIIVELDANIKKLFKDSIQFAKNPESLKGDQFDVVCSFRPAWQGFEKEYLSLLAGLTPRMKHEHFSKINNQNEVKFWQCLRELVV